MGDFKTFITLTLRTFNITCFTLKKLTCIQSNSKNITRGISHLRCLCFLSYNKKCFVANSLCKFYVWMDSEISQAHAKRLDSHDQLLQRTLEIGSYSKLYSFKHIVNGFAVHVTPSQVLYMPMQAQLLKPLSFFFKYKSICTYITLE